MITYKDDRGRLHISTNRVTTTVTGGLGVDLVEHVEAVQLTTGTLVIDIEGTRYKARLNTRRRESVIKFLRVFLRHYDARNPEWQTLVTVEK